MNTTGIRAWTVGELAEHFELTVRTLHHWESVGLLTPQRSEAGHRIYGPVEQGRVRDTLVLRELGLPLEDVRRALDEPSGFDLGTFLAEEAERLSDQIAHLERRRSGLRALQEACGPDVGPRTLLGALERVAVALTQLSPGQMRRLEAINEALSDEHLSELTRRGNAVLCELKELHAAGAPADAPEVLDAAARSRELLIETTGGDLEMAVTLERMSLQAGFGDGFDGVETIDETQRSWLRDAVSHLPGSPDG